MCTVVGYAYMVKFKKVKNPTLLNCKAKSYYKKITKISGKNIFSSTNLFIAVFKNQKPVVSLKF